jgi:hypothetical protein
MRLGLILLLSLSLSLALDLTAEERKLVHGTLLLPEKRPAPAVILTAPNARETATELVARGIAVLLATAHTDVVAAAREVAWLREIRSGELGVAGAPSAKEPGPRSRSIAFTIADTDTAAITAAVQRLAGKRGAISKEIAELNRAMEEAVRRGDLAAVAKFYAPDGEVRGPGTAIRGREALTAYWSALKHATDWKLEVLETGGSRDAPWQRGRSILRTPERDHAVDFVLLFKRNTNRKLEIVLDFYF